jgi:DNA repair protein RadC
MTETEGKPHYLGHRQRLRARFMADGGDGFQDYELLEFLLTLAIPRRDTKPLAKELLARFKSFAEVIAASPEQLKEFGLSETAIAALKVVEAPSCAWRSARRSAARSCHHGRRYSTIATPPWRASPKSISVCCSSTGRTD